MMNKKVFGIKISTIISVLVCLIAAILFWTMANLPESVFEACSDVVEPVIEGVRYV